MFKLCYCVCLLLVGFERLWSCWILWFWVKIMFRLLFGCVTLSWLFGVVIIGTDFDLIVLLGFCLTCGFVLFFVLLNYLVVSVTICWGLLFVL